MSSRRRKFVWITVILVIFTGVLGLRDVKIDVPLAVKVNDTAVLHCYFDMQGEPLYSVKWYRGFEEIYTFLPKEAPSIKVFHRPTTRHLHIEKSKSNATQLTLKNVSIPLSGKYMCEVSADAPSFRTLSVSAEMHVVVVPEGYPEVEGVRRRYKVGDTLKASCVSQHSRPAANLSWTINGVPLSTEFVRQYRVMRKPSTNLETSLSTIAFELTRDHFKINGRIKVRCTASVFNIYWQTSEISAEEERPKASVVAAQDYRLNEVLKRPTDSPYEVTVAAPNSGSASVVRWFFHSSYSCSILYILYSCYMFLYIYVPICF